MQQSQRNWNGKRVREKDNPALSKVIERNIRTIIHLRTKDARERSLQGRIEDVLAEIHRLQEIEVKKSKSYSSGMLFTEE